MKYVCLLRGINVGGKNKVSMATLRQILEDNCFGSVSTYINSGNIILESNTPKVQDIEGQISKLLSKNFTLDTDIIKIKIITADELDKVVANAPKGFGSQPDIHHSDVLFPMDVSAEEVMADIKTNSEVDAAWMANDVIYFQRVSDLRTRSRLSKIVESPVYKSITIRNWNTTRKLLALAKENK